MGDRRPLGYWGLTPPPPPPISTRPFSAGFHLISPKADWPTLPVARLHWLCGISWCLTWFTHKAALWIYLKLFFQDLARTLCFTWMTWLRMIFATFCLNRWLREFSLAWFQPWMKEERIKLDKGGIEPRSLVQQAFIKASWADQWLFGWLA